ncbi:MAG TPA: NAD(+)/NADH kinase [Solirubrobacteraceae bacterium]
MSGVAASAQDQRPGGRRRRPAKTVRTATILTHRRPQETGPAIKCLLDVARRAGAVLIVDPEEARKHGLSPGEGLEIEANDRTDVDICFALGGDGTILTALRLYAGTGVPVFAVNFGEIGFLATVEREEAAPGFEAALKGEFEVLSLPAITVFDSRPAWLAMNDVSIHRQPGLRVADLAYAIGDDEIGRVRCDGLVVATPAGSTGYNLANGGPILAWGVEGFAVSFIAPHSLTARSLVVAPDDALTIFNRSQEEPVEITVDARPAGTLAPGEDIQLRFVRNQGALAQVPGASFYHRLRQKFGRLATPL